MFVYAREASIIIVMIDQRRSSSSHPLLSSGGVFEERGKVVLRVVYVVLCGPLSLVISVVCIGLVLEKLIYGRGAQGTRCGVWGGVRSACCMCCV